MIGKHTQQIGLSGILVLMLLLVLAVFGDETWQNPFTEETRLYFTGDIMLDRNVRVWQQNNGFLYPVYDILPTVWEADLLSGNLESVISDKGSPMNKMYIFRALPEQMELLQLCGFDLLSVANNHALDYLFPAFLDNMERLDSAEIAHVGGGKNLPNALEHRILLVNNISIAFFGLNDTRTNFITCTQPCTVPSWPGNERRIMDRIERVDSLVDLVIVHVHWGTEDTTFQNSRQEVLGRLLLDSGADLVIGHHPHRLQPVEFNDNGIIAYSLGNFIFDQNDSLNRLGGILDVRLRDKEISSVNMIPVQNFSPARAAGPVVPEIEDFAISQMSRILGRNNVKPVWTGDRFRLEKRIAEQ